MSYTTATACCAAGKEHLFADPLAFWGGVTGGLAVLLILLAVILLIIWFLTGRDGD